MSGIDEMPERVRLKMDEHVVHEVWEWDRSFIDKFLQELQICMQMCDSDHQMLGLLNNEVEE